MTISLPDKCRVLHSCPLLGICERLLGLTIRAVASAIGTIVAALPGGLPWCVALSFS